MRASANRDGLSNSTSSAGVRSLTAARRCSTCGSTRRAALSRSLIARSTVRLAPYDALVLPTTANTPPRIADLADDKAFTAQNLLALRNCTLINMIDGCAISLPCHREGEVPVGLMLAGAGGSDRRIFELAASIEEAIRV